MKKIAFEEHFSIQEQLDSSLAVIRNEYHLPEISREEKTLEREMAFLYPTIVPHIVDKLLDIGEQRIKDMDNCGIDMQVLSLISPGVQVFDPVTACGMARRANDKLAEAVNKYPDRFVGLASIAPQDPEEAAKELERTVNQLGFRGANINSHTKGEYLDDRKFWGIFEKAEELGVPIYIHPRAPSPDMIKPYLAYQRLSGSLLGFAAEVALHVVRLICSGVFDKYPGLNIILGHMGETVPSLLWRMDNVWQRGPSPDRPKRLPSEYFRDNFFVTTSGMFWIPPLLFACSVAGINRILFAVDYPVESNEEAVRLIDDAPISDIDKEKICHLNAEKLLGLG